MQLKQYCSGRVFLIEFILLEQQIKFYIINYQ